VRFSPNPVLERRSDKLGLRMPLVLAAPSPSRLEAVAVAASSAIVYFGGRAHTSRTSR
jgi:hypothetical protein